MKREVQLASGYKTLIVPFFIERVEPSGAFAYELKTRQWIDGYANWDAGLRELMAVLALDGQPTQTQEPATPSGAERWQLRRAMLVVGALVLAAIGAATWLERGVRNSAPRPTTTTPQTTTPEPATPARSNPKWATLQPGTDFVNLGTTDVSVFKNPDIGSEVLETIKPGARLFLSGDPAPIEVRHD